MFELYDSLRASWLPRSLTSLTDRDGLDPLVLSFDLELCTPIEIRYICSVAHPSVRDEMHSHHEVLLIPIHPSSRSADLIRTAAARGHVGPMTSVAGMAVS